METQGSRLKKIRQLLDLSQADFGEKIGVSKQYISNLEADRNFLNNEKLVSLLVDLNVNINYLLDGRGEVFIPENEDSDEVLTRKVRAILKNEGLIKN
ncbi:MAG: helix-turn-helix transcriptional regulator [bacterium]|nr:helix-turn-helix transcriptional regulator [bacterium]